MVCCLPISVAHSHVTKQVNSKTKLGSFPSTLFPPRSTALLLHCGVYWLHKEIKIKASFILEKMKKHVKRRKSDPEKS